MDQKLREEISLNILRCRDMLEQISKINNSEALKFSKKLDELITKYKQDIENIKEEFSVKSGQEIEARLVIDLEDLILDFSYLNDLNELENYFDNEIILEKEYDSVILTYNKMSNMLDKISSKIDIEKLTELISKKYKFLYKIVCRAVLEKEEFPNIDETDIKQIRIMIENDLETLNPEIDNLNIEDIREYIKYLNEIKKTKSNKSLFGKSNSRENKEKTKRKTKKGILDKMTDKMLDILMPELGSLDEYFKLGSEEKETNAFPIENKK